MSRGGAAWDGEIQNGGGARLNGVGRGLGEAKEVRDGKEWDGKGWSKVEIGWGSGAGFKGGPSGDKFFRMKVKESEGALGVFFS